MRVSMKVLAIAVLCTACGKLDPFLYTPKRTDQYVLDPQGYSPEETVSPERIERLSIVGEEATLGAVRVRANETPARAAILFFHGKTDHLDGQFWRMKRLANLGYDVLGFDYRGFGASTPLTPTEAGVEKDTRAARAFFVGLLGNADRLVYYGHSFGTAAATQRAELDPPKVLVLEAAFASIDEFQRDSTQMDLPPGFIAKDSWNTLGRMPNIHAPVLLMHGKADDYVRPEFSEKLFAKANDPKKLILVDGAEHDVARVMADAYGTEIHAFIQAHLP